MDAEQKTFRLMTLQSRLLHGEVLRKRALAQEFGVSERSIQRDLENLRVYFEQQNPPRELIYSRAKGGFRLDGGEQLLIQMTGSPGWADKIPYPRDLIAIFAQYLLRESGQNS